jgi:hypothetical protein
MENVLIKRKELLIAVFQFLLVLGIIIGAQFFSNQFITGTIVNALLISSVVLLGLRQSFGIAIIPSLFALGFGFLPSVLAPFIPFIIVANIILILCFYFLKDKNYWFGVIIGSIFKFSFLFFSSSIIFGNSLPAKVLEMMAYPQLFTALMGSILAFIILKSLKKI